jgi:hypothetical protein
LVVSLAGIAIPLALVALILHIGPRRFQISDSAAYMIALGYGTAMVAGLIAIACRRAAVARVPGSQDPEANV